jgi:hypothetical protein
MEKRIVKDDTCDRQLASQVSGGLGLADFSAGVDINIDLFKTLFYN